MINADVPVFPNNIVDLIAAHADTLDPDPVNRLQVFKRPLRPTDVGAIQAIGIAASTWEPDDDSMEMRGFRPAEPTIQRYMLGLQALVVDADEYRGLATHSVLSTMLRTMLYRDPILRLALPTLSVTMGSSTEKLMRWGVRGQTFLSRDIEAVGFGYLSTIQMWAETETS